MRCCLCAAVRFRILMAPVLAAAACGAGHLGGDPAPDPHTSPGTVTLHLSLPSSQSFCDLTSGCGAGVSHVSYRTLLGQELDTGARWCFTDCGTCSQAPCPAIPACPVLAVGQAITDVEVSWDGAFNQSGSCGASVACFSPQFVPPGRYVGHMCATPGTVNTSGDGGPPCTQTADPECVDVPFDLPGPSPVTATLPTVLPPPPLR